MPAWLVQGIAWVNAQTKLANAFPFQSIAIGHFEGLRGNILKALGVTPLGENLKQLLMNCDTPGVATQGLLQDFLSLQITSIGQVDIGFGDWVDVVYSIKLAGCVRHRGTGCGTVIGIDTLPATGTKEGGGSQTAFQEGTVDMGGVLALPVSVQPQTR